MDCRQPEIFAGGARGWKARWVFVLKIPSAEPPAPELQLSHRCRRHQTDPPSEAVVAARTPLYQFQGRLYVCSILLESKRSEASF